MKRTREQDEELERLDDYVRGLGTDADVAWFEGDLFARALSGEARELRAFDWLAATFRQLGDRGTFMNYLSAVQAAEMQRRYGGRIMFVEMPLGTERQRVVLDPNAELLLTRTPIDASGIDRIDVEAHVEGVGLVKTMPDVTFDAEEGVIWGCCEMELARQTAGMPLLSKYWGYNRDGRRLLGEVLAFAELG